MLCHAAMITPSHGISENETVDAALKMLKNSQTGVVPVCDDNGVLVGVFSITALLKSIMPVNVPVSGGFMPDVQLPAAPGMAKRLEKIMMARVHEVMDRRPQIVAPQSPLTDAISAFSSSGDNAVIVIEPDSKKPLGVITPQSAYLEISRMKDSR